MSEEKNHRKKRKRPAPIRIEEAISQGILRVVTDPKEISDLTRREIRKMGYKNHTDISKHRIDDDSRYSDTSYTIDPQFRGSFGL
jgi:hypothetical protein